MDRIWHSVAFRLALICGGLVVASVLLMSAVFYLGTVGVMARDTDTKIADIAKRFTEDAENNGLQSLVKRLEQTLTDGVDSDSEILLLTRPTGQKIAGNIAGWTDDTAPLDRVIDRPVMHSGKISVSRVLIHRFPGGAVLVVGRDMRDLNAIRDLIATAVAYGGLLALFLALGGTLLFRRQIETRVWAIRQAALDIEAGNLERRIPMSDVPDEFDRLSADINRMLDRIQNLMEGVRHVSNTIAHNLRTPLGLIRNHLDEALRGQANHKNLEQAGNFAIEEIDSLIVVLEKLLQIAQAESGTRRQPFDNVYVRPFITDLLELYDAAAESLGVEIITDIEGDPVVVGDKDLLESILANLLDNSLKYAGSPAVVHIRADQSDDTVRISVQDNGPGISAGEHEKVLQRFYRLDRHQRGSGLGLSIVAAITQLHGGRLTLEDANPGLRVTIWIPRGVAPTLPNGNVISV